MGRTDDPQEWLRLNQRYQQMGDDELVQLRDDFDDLTPTAQDVLRPILQGRGLWPHPTTSEIEPAETHRADYSFVRTASDAQCPVTADRDSLLKDNGVAVRACESLDDASLLREYLQENKIESLVVTTKRGYPVRFPEILVFPDDVERASELLAQADIDALRRAAEDDSGPIIDGSSQCPACGSAEILLQPSRPDCLNAWLCANCGRSWQDNLPTDWKAGG
jgi:hypothetical protein